MYKIYNNQEDFATSIFKFLKNIFPNMRKTQLNILPYIILGMILAESVVPIDIARELKFKFSFVQIDSTVKRIRRFFKNKLFNPYTLYHHIISHVVKSYKKKHPDKKVHIIFDHMFSHDNYTVFMITMRIGKQSIPLWFKTFKGRDCPEAFQEDLLKEGISYVSNLFPKNFKLIFLADRWFNSISLLKHIDSLGHIYRIRLRTNHRIFIFDKKENHKIWKWVYDLQSYEYHSTFYDNIEITNEKYITNIVISPRHDYDEPWIIVTNGSYKQALIDYSYRYGGIECFFKNQKSNGFYLENTVNASLKYFESMYTIACIGVLFLTILGADYSKNTKCYKNVKITTHTTSNNKKIRILSLFNTGLTLFKLAFNASVYIRIPYSFVLYDI